MLDEKQLYDLIIIGAGPAGLTASIYASRYKINNLVLGPETGGTISKAHLVENYPGFTSITGFELGQRMGAQVKSLGAEIAPESVTKISKTSQGYELFTNNEKIYYAKTVLVASGTERKKLSITGEDAYLGKGVSYCTNCDAPFFRNKTAIVVGGGDSAITGALHLEDFAKTTYLIYRGKKEALKAEPVWIDKLLNSKVTCIYETNILEVLGDEQKVNKVKLDKQYNGQEFIETDGLFIEIGAVPVSKLMVPLGVEVDNTGFIKVNEFMETNVSGLYAAGDITTSGTLLQQVVIASAQGAMAAASIFKKLKKEDVAPKQWGETLVKI